MPKGGFVSRAQQAAVMSQYNKAGFKERPIRVDRMKNFFSVRVRPPSAFQSLRTKDIGRPGHMTAIVGRPKGMTTTRIQAVRIPARSIRA